MKMNIPVIAAVAVLTFAACSVRIVDNKELNGEMVEKTFDIKDFNRLKISTYCDVYYTVGDSFSVRVKTSEGLMKDLIMENKDSMLRISRVDGSKNMRVWRINQTKSGNQEIYITAPYLKEIKVNGSAGFICKDTICTEDFCVRIAGSGDVKLAGVMANSVEFDMAGSGDIKAGLQNVEWSGFKIAGSGDMDINFQDCGEASVSIAGSGDVKLKGTLGTFTQSVAGSGDIETKELQLTGKKRQ